jgi:poly(hydroxyalkanoate) depolymerase family esterase
MSFNLRERTTVNRPFRPGVPPVDARAIHDTIQRALAAAGLDASTGPLREATETIRRALLAAGLTEAADATHASTDAATVIDVEAREVPAHQPQPDDAVPQPTAVPTQASTQAPTQAPTQTSTQAKVQAPGTFESHPFNCDAGARAYKLYVPAGPSTAPRPMLVMLHGCTQSADDFALGTQMNRQADAHGFLVVYPEQSKHANPSKCWNWFRPQDQQRDAGEPAVIAGIVQEVAQRHGADPGRIFVAGLSAGAAMAVVLGEAYPDLFAGVGAHSGLPFGSAHDVTSALAAMKGGRSGLMQMPQSPHLHALPGTKAPGLRKAGQAVPTIVFQGDRDHTVQPSNAAEIVKQARAAHLAQGDEFSLTASAQQGQSTGGRRYSRSVEVDHLNHVRIEWWALHGAGHAWSGGDARGSYTDVTGPDASAEMVRFFLALP